MWLAQRTWVWFCLQLQEGWRGRCSEWSCTREQRGLLLWQCELRNYQMIISFSFCHYLSLSLNLCIFKKLNLEFVFKRLVEHSQSRLWIIWRRSDGCRSVVPYLRTTIPPFRQVRCTTKLKYSLSNAWYSMTKQRAIMLNRAWYWCNMNIVCNMSTINVFSTKKYAYSLLQPTACH